MFNQKFKIMKNLMQKLVNTILCLGIVSVSLIACDSETVDDTVIQLDKLDNQLLDSDSSAVDSTANVDEQSDAVLPEEEVKETV